MKFTILSLSILVLALLNLFIGSVHIPPREVFDILLGNADMDDAHAYIVVANRLPMAVTAIFAGASLAAAGLLLQTAFRNPLAGPSVLGVNSGASLGVAVVMLAFGGSVTVGSLSLSGNGAVVLGAFIGSMLIMGLLLALSSMLRNSLMLLITGIMIGYLTSSVIMLLNFTSRADGIAGYVMWGMSSFGGVSLTRLPLLCGISAVGIILALTLIKPLDLLLLGDNYASNLGIDTRRVRNLLLLSTGILVAVTTAYCGPVSFLGLSVPHITRIFFPTDSHRVLLPATLLTGSAVALICNLICVSPSSSVLPLNAVTPLIGAPVVIWVLLSRRYR